MGFFIIFIVIIIFIYYYFYLLIGSEGYFYYLLFLRENIKLSCSSHVYHTCSYIFLTILQLKFVNNLICSCLILSVK